MYWLYVFTFIYCSNKMLTPAPHYGPPGCDRQKQLWVSFWRVLRVQEAPGWWPVLCRVLQEGSNQGQAGGGRHHGREGSGCVSGECWQPPFLLSWPVPHRYWSLLTCTFLCSLFSLHVLGVLSSYLFIHLSFHPCSIIVVTASHIHYTSPFIHFSLA